MRRGKIGLVFLVSTFAGCGVDFIALRLQGPMQVNPGARVDILDGQVYATRGGQELQYDLYRPMDDAGPRPLVVLVHGGSWRSGERTDLIEWCYDLAAHGYAATTIDYRLTKNGVVFPAPVSDVLAAIRFFRGQAVTCGIDASRVAVFGMSAGGQLALLAGLTNDASVFDSDRPAGESAGVKCVLDLFGPTDFTVDPSTVEPDQIQRVERYLGKSIAEAGELLRVASPITYVRTDGPPVLVIHGDSDMTVPVDQARRLIAAMNAVGEANVYLEVPGMDHIPGAIWQGEFAQGYRSTVLDFLRERL